QDIWCESGQRVGELTTREPGVEGTAGSDLDRAEKSEQPCRTTGRSAGDAGMRGLHLRSQRFPNLSDNFEHFTEGSILLRRDPHRWRLASLGEVGAQNVAYSWARRCRLRPVVCHVAHLAAFETGWFSLLDMGGDRFAKVVGQIQLHRIGEGR